MKLLDTVRIKCGMFAGRLATIAQVFDGSIYTVEVFGVYGKKWAYLEVELELVEAA